jgi:hypothetical protein
LNQEDDLEKGQQVQLMGKIFKNANKVHSWLRDDDGVGDTPSSTIRKLALRQKALEAKDADDENWTESQPQVSTSELDQSMCVVRIPA